MLGVLHSKATLTGTNTSMCIQDALTPKSKKCGKYSFRENRTFWKKKKSRSWTIASERKKSSDCMFCYHAIFHGVQGKQGKKSFLLE